MTQIRVPCKSAAFTVLFWPHHHFTLPIGILYMIKNLISFALFAILLFVSSCGSPKNENKLSLEQAIVPVGDIRKGATERHARVGMNTIRIAEERRIALTKVAEVTPYYQGDDGNLIYYISETIPTYAGGDPAIALFLEENLRYPVSNMEENREGTIFVDFIINANGSIRDKSTTDSTFAGDDEAFRKEAIRLVNLMPKWIPGRQHGKAVDVKYSVPITFLLM